MRNKGIVDVFWIFIVAIIISALVMPFITNFFNGRIQDNISYACLIIAIVLFIGNVIAAVILDRRLKRKDNTDVPK